jgi:hypothetical protein
MQNGQIIKKKKRMRVRILYSWRDFKQQGIMKSRERGTYLAG